MKAGAAPPASVMRKIGSGFLQNHATTRKTGAER
jgi:hypothetical protein